jgi:hypothetical protein
MLKTRVGNETWLVHQPDHARVAGYLAAHWGGGEAFARPGYYAAAPEPELLRQEVVQAVAEHDNGWWEWEAAPTIDADDGFPLGLAQVGRQSPAAGLDRWRLGVPRLAESHPYIALMISLHAYWLYAFAFESPTTEHNAFRHPLFGSPGVANKLVPDRRLAEQFLAEQRCGQERLMQQLRGDALWAAAVEPAHREPHVRLLQVLDAMSLLLAFGGQQEQQLLDVPGRTWDDRRTVMWRPAAAGGRRIVCDPFPFDLDPLEVFLPVRVAPAAQSCAEGTPLPLIQLHSLPLRTVQFVLSSRP